MKSLSTFTVLLSFLWAANAQTLDELKNPNANPNNILNYGMDQGQQRFSRLKQINKSNVKKLVPVWSTSLENDYGEQAQPLIRDGVMYVSNAKWTAAIDAMTGKQLWRTPTEFEPETPRVVCCGVSNKGVALYNGMVFRGTLDAHMVALDQKTGKEIWKTKVIEWRDGYSITSAPIVANGVLLTGISGAEFGIRGFIDGYDPATGKHLWRRHTTASPDEKGGDTWKVKDSYLNGGGSTWVTGSYDPELDLVYWGSGNAGPWNADYRGGDSLYTASVIAMRPKTGEIVWHYQFTPNDVYDYDAVSELILANLNIGSKSQKVVMQLNRNGFVYVLDRENGKLISAKPYAKVNWASHIDMESGRPVETDVAKKLRAGELVTVWPNVLGSKNWFHASFNPLTNFLYTNTQNYSTTYRLAKLDKYVPGQRWVGTADLKHNIADSEVKGYLEAIDPMSGKAKWQIPFNDTPNWSSVMTTAGGLLFTGRHNGEFMAVDVDTGKVLWKFKTSSGINAQPITWTQNGKQYVTVLSGLGGLGAVRTISAEQIKTIPRGGSVWTFALPN